MKVLNYDSVTYYIGTAREVLSLHRNTARLDIFRPIFAEEPKLTKDRIYGLAVYHDDNFDYFYGRSAVISETDVCYLLMGEIERLTAPIIIDGDELECMTEALPF